MLDSFLEKIALKGRPLIVRLLVYGLYFVGPAAALLVGWNNFYNARLAWVSTEITRPHDAYARVAPDMAVWRPSPAYEDAFFAAFSQHYFGQPSSWAAISADIDGAELNIVLQNQATSSPVLVNSVSAIAMLEDERPFPWRRLDTTADLALRLDGDVLVAESVGLGPVKALEITPVTAAGAALARYEGALLTGTALVELRPAGGAAAFRTFSANGGRLEKPLFQRWPDGENVPAGAEAHQCQPASPGGAVAACRFARRDRPNGPTTVTGSPCDCDMQAVFETVETEDRLAQLTEIVVVDEVRVNWRHADLKGEVSEGAETMTLTAPRRFYRRQAGLLTEPPHLGLRATDGFDPGAAPPPVSALISEFAGLVGSVAPIVETVFGDKKTDRGVALISTVHNVSVADLGECAFAQSIKEPRELLAGAGYVAVHLDLDQPRNGRYLIRVLVNGEEVRALRLDVLRPDDERFDVEDVDRFAERAPAPPSPCAPTPAPGGE